MKQIRDLLIGPKEPDLKNAGWVSFDKNTQKYELKFFINGRWLPMVSNIDTIEPEKIEKVKEFIEWINNNGTDFNNSKVSSITWNNDIDPSNMNDFVVAGVYDIKGERTRGNDNLPILNTGGGHSFNARLTVLDSSISGSGRDDDKCITQILSLSNRLGQGEIYIRTGKGSSLNNLTWEKWSTLQRNVNVNNVESLDDLKDNGIYSGVWLRGHYNNYPITFVCVVINDYFIGVAPRRISQFVYGLSKFDGSVVYQSRVWDDSKDKWGDWEILNKKELSSMISSEISKIVDNAPETFDTLKEIADWINNDESGAAAMLKAINENKSTIKELSEVDGRLAEYITTVDEDYATKVSEIKSKALHYNSLHVVPTAEKVNIGGKSVDGANTLWMDIPAATTEKAGVMMATDKKKLNNLAVEGANVDLNTYSLDGVYFFSCKRLTNVPILNDSVVSARLTVLTAYDGSSPVITQVLNLNNLGGGEGNIYIRSYQNGEWKPWGKLQANVEVGQISQTQMDDVINNGMYSGVCVDTLETFILVVINNYAIATATNQGLYISQLKYSVDTNGNTSVATRTRDAYGMWNEWVSLDEKSLVNEEKIRAMAAEAELEEKIEENKELATEAPNLALRALFIAAGATYNGSTGNYELNGIADLTESDMIYIYEHKNYHFSLNTARYFQENKNVRTIFPMNTLNTVYDQLFKNNKLSLFYTFLNSNLEVIKFSKSQTLGQTKGIPTESGGMSSMFTNAKKLKTVYPIDVSAVTSIGASFDGTIALIDVRLCGLKCSAIFKDSTNISKESILYIIQCALPASAIIITLHPDAYARLADDSDIVAALEAQPLVTLVSA